MSKLIRLQQLKDNRKLQLISSLILIIACCIFYFGRLSVDIPSREVMCAEIIKSNAILIDAAKEKEKEYTEKIRLCHDEEYKVCTARIVEELDKYKAESPSLDCRVCKAAVPQCKARKEPICK